MCTHTMVRDTESTTDSQVTVIVGGGGRSGGDRRPPQMMRELGSESTFSCKAKEEFQYCRISVISSAAADMLVTASSSIDTCTTPR